MLTQVDGVAIVRTLENQSILVAIQNAVGSHNEVVEADVKALYALNGIGAIPTALNPYEIRREKSRQQMLLQKAKAKAKAKSNVKINKKTPRKG